MLFCFLAKIKIDKPPFSTANLRRKYIAASRNLNKEYVLSSSFLPTLDMKIRIFLKAAANLLSKLI